MTNVPVLVPMSQELFSEFAVEANEGYAEDHVLAGTWAPDEALAKATAQFNQLLPQGIDTSGHFFYEVRDRSNATVGYLLVCRCWRWGGQGGLCLQHSHPSGSATQGPRQRRASCPRVDCGWDAVARDPLKRFWSQSRCPSPIPGARLRGHLVEHAQTIAAVTPNLPSSGPSPAGFACLRGPLESNVTTHDEDT